jgi:hypothetical protein
MYWINGDNHAMCGGRMSFYADTLDDVVNLPTSTREGIPQIGDVLAHKKVKKGSTCLVIDPVTALMLNSQDEWKDVTTGTGGKGKDGYSPQITVKTDTDDTYILSITYLNAETGQIETMDTPNLKGGGASTELTPEQVNQLINLI